MPKGGEGVERFRVARGEVSRIGSIMKVFAILVAAWIGLGVVLLGALHLPAVSLAAGLGAMVVPLLIYLNLPGWVDVGTDGLLLDLRGPKRYVPFSELEGATLFRKSAGGKCFVGVALALTSGAPIEIPLGEDQFGAGDRADVLARSIAAALNRYRQAGGADHAAALERGDATAAAWVTKLRTIGEGANAGPRAAPVPADVLLRIVEDPQASAPARASAAVALAKNADADGRARIAAAGAATASPRLRIALEAATGDDDAAIATALEEVDREADA
jgi:hypothetical protein